MSRITALSKTIQGSRITVIASYSGNRYTYGELKIILSIAEQSNVSVGFISLTKINAFSLKNLILVYAGLDCEKLVDTSEAFYNSNLLFDVLKKKRQMNV